MKHHLDLQEEEVELIHELLRDERDGLPIEIRHTDTPTYRDVLKHRQDVVKHLLDRIGPIRVH